MKADIEKTHKIELGHYPSVSIAIPSLNEAEKIEKVVQGFLSSEYPSLKEIYIADGGSTDGTVSIIEKLSRIDPRVKLISNEQRIQSAALNLILQACEGEIFLRADAHSDYAPDFVERSVEALVKSGALDAGGAQRFVAETNFQSGIALAAKTFFGSGGAKYRDPNYDGYADTVFLGCFWTDKLQKMGGFSLARNEDGELSLRLNQAQDKAVYVSSKIKVWYYPRKTWKRLLRQYIKYGRGRCLTHTRNPDKFHLRSTIPLLLLPSLLLLALTSFILYSNGFKSIAFIVLVSAFAFPGIASAKAVIQTYKNFDREIWRSSCAPPSFLIRLFYCWVASVTMPVGYNVGYLYQLYLLRVLRRDSAVFFE